MSATILEAFIDHARSVPDRLALAIPGPGDRAIAEHATFGQLLERAERFAAGLRSAGFREGDRLLLASAPSVDFYALTLAVSGCGMTIVFIDGGMDRRRLFNALRQARARGVVGSPEVLRRWWLVPHMHRMRRFSPAPAPIGVRALDQLLGPAGASALSAPPADAAAGVSFTSGSTGRAKGVVRTNAIVYGQHRALARHFPVSPDDVHMPCFPAVALHSLACGIPTVLPPIDLRHPGEADAAAVVDVARSMGVTTLSGAPAYMWRIVEHLRATGEHLPEVRHVVVGGAPVPRALCAGLVETLPQADARILYGSTEVEPIAHVSMAEVLASSGEGLLVGAPVPEVDVAIVDLPDRLEGELDDAGLNGHRVSVGEVVVRGDGVSRTYVGDPAAVAAHKVRQPGGVVWHRTGDMARMDDEGRLRLLGRRGQVVAHRGRELHPLPLEAAVDELDGVGRAALVSHAAAPDGELAVVVDGAGGPAAVRTWLDHAGLEHLRVRVVEAIPTDRRHNSKVDRALLAAWLAREARGSGATRARRDARSPSMSMPTDP